MSLIIDGWLHDDYGGRTYSTLHILKHKHPGTLNTHLLKMDVWWFPTISQVKVWFIFQLKQPIQNPGCLVRLPGMWPSVGGRFNHFQAFKSFSLFSEVLSQCHSLLFVSPQARTWEIEPGPDRKKGGIWHRKICSQGCVFTCIYIYISYYLYKYIYLYIYVYTLFVNVDLWLTHTLITKCDIVFNKSYMLYACRTCMYFHVPNAIWMCKARS